MSDRSDTAEALPPDTSATEALANVVEESRREYDKKFVQVSLSLGIVFLLASASLIVLRAVYGIQPSLTLAVVAFSFLAFRTYLSDSD
jgi:hypothetical protein